MVVVTPAWIDGLAERFARGFRSGSVGLRTVGREAEFPVVHPDGTAAPISELWGPLQRGGGLDAHHEGDMIVGLTGPRYGYAAEVGFGTIELVGAPCQDLHELAGMHDEAFGRLCEAAAEVGFRVLGAGIQPVTPATVALMTKKRRYVALHDAIGELWLSFAATASDQLHVHMGREELIAATNLCNLMAPVVVALCANSAIAGGRDLGVCSGREHEMGRIGVAAGRHGMPMGPVDGWSGHVARLAAMEFLVDRRGDEVEIVGGTFAEWVERRGGLPDDEAFRAFLVHEHYVWNTARPRSAHGTLEMRSACQQPISEHLAAATLSLGLVQSAPALAAWIREVLPADPWPTMRAWHVRAVLDGLAAPEPIPDFLATVLDILEDGLIQRGRGEQAYLAPLRRRLAKRTNPAQHARQVFADGGIAALIEHSAA